MNSIFQPQYEAEIHNKLETIKLQLRNVAEGELVKQYPSSLYITIGMEGTAKRGVDPTLAIKLFNTIQEYPHLRFILLLRGDIPSDFHVPENCLVGIEVKRESDIHRIADLTGINADSNFVMFVPDKWFDIYCLSLKGVDIVILEGNLDEELHEWEENLLSLAYEYPTTLCYYDKSYEINGYKRGIVSDKIVGFRSLNCL